MRLPYSLWGCVAVSAALNNGCNIMIGLEEVTLSPPDGALPDAAPPDAAECHVDSTIQLVVSNPLTSIAIPPSEEHGPIVVFALNTDPRPDMLSVSLYPNMGGHGAFVAPGTYDLTQADATAATCGVCALVLVDFDRDTSRPAATFMALSQGHLSLTVSDATRIAGSMRNLRFRHVELSGGSTEEIGDSCTVAINDVRFDLTYETTDD
jgi:hypothetical protein